MEESAFIAAADATLEKIGLALDAALETSDADLDWSLRDGVLTIECDDASRIIVNRHVPNREIWVAARSGGLHFRARAGALARFSRAGRARERAHASSQGAGAHHFAHAGTRCADHRLIAAFPLPARAVRADARAVRQAVSGREERAPVIELPPERRVTRQQRLDHRPEALRMIELDDVCDLVRDNVLGEHRRQLHEPPVEADLAFRVAAAPFAARVRQANARRLARDAPHVTGDRGGDERPAPDP